MATPLSDERPQLTLVKETPETARVFEFEKRPRPAWMMSGEQLRQWTVYAKDNTVDAVRFHATHSPYYLGWSVRGYRRLCKRWWEARDDDYRQMIASAKQMIRDAKWKPAEEARAKALLEVRRAEFKRHKQILWIKTGICGLGLAVGGGILAATGGLWVQILMAIAVIVTGAWFGRPEQPIAAPVQAPTRTSHLGEDTMRRVLVESGAVPEKRAAEVRGVGIPHSEGPGIAYEVDLPSGIPAAVAVARKQQLASALAVHQDWLDLEVGDIESRLKVWVASSDPFAIVRRSPLLDHEGPINTFRDGIKVAFGKRGEPITLWIRDSSLIVGGATRRGKGMLLANILLGVAKDPWVNVRIFDGKGTAEHNAYARIMGTFTKRNAERLALATRAIVAEMDRRSDLLDEHGYEKIDDENYEECMRLLGGREVFIVDELATYTPTGTSQWADEITENLSQIAAVGAALGITLISLTQVPEVDVVRGRLRQNHTSRAAMNTESGTASNTILGDGMTGQGHDASKIPLTQPGRAWLSTPETGVIQVRSYLVKPDDKRRAADEAYEIRKAAGRLPGPWKDPIEEYLLAETGVSSAAGGEGGKGRIGGTAPKVPEPIALARAAFASVGDPDRMTSTDLYKLVAATSNSWAPEEDADADQARDRFLKALREVAADVAPGVDMKVKQWSGGRGYYLATILALTGETAVKRP